MRIDPEHRAKLTRAISRNDAGRQEVNLDIAFMTTAMDRLSLWERGLLVNSIMRAAKARRRTIEQRALLALFVHDGGDNA